MPYKLIEVRNDEVWLWAVFDSIRKGPHRCWSDGVIQVTGSDPDPVPESPPARQEGE